MLPRPHLHSPSLVTFLTERGERDLERWVEGAQVFRERSGKLIIKHHDGESAALRLRVSVDGGRQNFGILFEAFDPEREGVGVEIKHLRIEAVSAVREGFSVRSVARSACALCVGPLQQETWYTLRLLRPPTAPSRRVPKEFEPGTAASPLEGGSFGSSSRAVAEEVRLAGSGILVACESPVHGKAS